MFIWINIIFIESRPPWIDIKILSNRAASVIFGSSVQSTYFCSEKSNTSHINVLHWLSEYCKYRSHTETQRHKNVIRWTCISISSNVKTGICHADGGMTGLSYIVSFARNILSLIVKYRIIIIYVRYLSDYRRPYSSSRFHDNSFRHFRLCQSLNRLIVNKIHFMMTNGIIGRLKNQNRKLIIRNIAASSSDIPLIPVRHPLFLHQTSVQ